MSNKIDISSSTLDKGLEVAKEFVDKLIMPATEEVGLLLKDSVSLWRMKNQVRVLMSAKGYCEENGIEPSQVSPKLLLPLLEGASIEDDELLQDKWAILLSNLVDSEQNIQNHVFPYILGQISSTEFMTLEAAYEQSLFRRARVREKLSEERQGLPEREEAVLIQIEELEKNIKERRSEGLKEYEPPMWRLRSDLRAKKSDLLEVRRKERILLRELEAEEVLPDESLQPYELSNTTRLGLIKQVLETYAPYQAVDLPDHEHGFSQIDLELDLVTDSHHVLTELGELFVNACTEKRDT